MLRHLIGRLKNVEYYDPASKLQLFVGIREPMVQYSGRKYHGCADNCNKIFVNSSEISDEIF